MPSAFDLNPTIYVHTLGGFSIEAGGNVINDRSNQSKKPWALLEYLIIFRKKDIGPAELIQAIWPDDPGANPAGALKTLMFRSRKLLEPLGIPPQKLLIQQRRTYGWTREFTTVLDIDEFEAVCTRVFNESLPKEEALSLCLTGIGLYRGDFLPKAGYESWVIPISAYYHTLYQKLVHYTINLLTAKEAFSQITSLCQAAISIEPFDEEFRYHLVYSLYRDGHTHQALEEYNNTLDLFYSEFSISPSDRFKDLYKIIRNDEQGISLDLDHIQDSLSQECSDGAFYCEYPVFRDLFQLERRAIDRTGDSIYLCMLTVTGLNGKVLKTMILNKAMGHLEASIRGSLRCSDVFTRYSISQYLLLLPTITSEMAERVLKRIIANFRKVYNRTDLTVDFCLQPLKPWNRDETF